MAELIEAAMEVNQLVDYMDDQDANMQQFLDDDEMQDSDEEEEQYQAQNNYNEDDTDFRKRSADDLSLDDDERLREL